MRYSKYRAIPTFVGKIRFHSKKEAARYKELLLLEKAGKISWLTCQVMYLLHVRDVVIGKYIADFVYAENELMVVEDVKGMKGGTPLYRWKSKHFEAEYGLKIRET